MGEFEKYMRYFKDLSEQERIRRIKYSGQETEESKKWHFTKDGELRKSKLWNV